MRLFSRLPGAPLYFEANCGQVDSAFQFIARGRDCNVLIAPNEAVVVLGKETNTPSVLPPDVPGLDSNAIFQTRSVGFHLVDANPRAALSGIQKLPGQANYYIGNEPAEWRTKIPLYPKVQVDEVYPGIRLIYYADESARLEYDFLLRPGARADQILWRMEGVDGAALDGAGNLVLKIGLEEIRQHAPVIYQMVQGIRKPINGGYRLAGPGELGFWTGDYDRHLPLVIDPSLSFSAYIGGRGNDKGWGIAVDGSGNVWIAGETLSPDLPSTAGALQSRFQGAHGIFGDGFVAKFASGTNLSYLTYLGGPGRDAAFAVATGTNGEAFITGYTDSRSFPITNAFQSHLGGTNLNATRGRLLDAFVTKLNSDGTLAYSTYLGGKGRDVGLGIAVDDQNRAYVTGFTESTDFPTTNGFQAKYGGVGDAFVARLSADGKTLEYSTFLGGTNQEIGQGIAVDAGHSAYVVGITSSTNFPTTTNGLSTVLNALRGHTLATDGFISKLSPDGASLVYSSYLGGEQNDVALAVAVDKLSNAYVTGYTFSTNFPVTLTNFTAWPSRTNFNSDVFVVKLDATGSTNNGYAVVFGGRLGEQGIGIAVDGAQNAYVVGATSSRTNFADLLPSAVMPPGFSATNSTLLRFGTSDAFVVQLDPAGNGLFAAYLGDSRNDQANGIAFDTIANAAYIVGTSFSTNFPGTSPSTFHGHGLRSDAFMSRIQFP